MYLEIVTLDQDFMQSRAKDFQLSAHVQTVTTVVANSNVETVSADKPYLKHTEPTIRTHHRWRNSLTSSTSHFCVDCWMRSKRRLLRRKNKRKLFKKRLDSKYIISSNQETSDSFIDDIFSLIK